MIARNSPVIVMGIEKEDLIVCCVAKLFVGLLVKLVNCHLRSRFTSETSLSQPRECWDHRSVTQYPI